MGIYSNFATAAQFVLYGRKHFRQPAFHRREKIWEKDGTDMIRNSDLYDMTAKVCIITGSNSGIGKEMAGYLARRGACVYMVCRNLERGTKARDEIIEASGNKNVYTLVCDVARQGQVREMWKDFLDHRQREASASVQGSGLDRTTVLDVLVCNAGALLNNKTVTEEGVETTFAAHLAFGTHLLGRLAMPSLERTPQSRLVITTSGGMYGAKVPKWDSMISREPEGEYNGVLAYARAKRGQVVLAEEWAKAYPNTKVVTAHPGWTKTPGTEAAFGDNEKYLNPMRTPWEGASGICWLCCVGAEQLDSGELYLDRTPQRKHIAGPLFSEGSYTKNTRNEVDYLMRKLEAWNFGSGIEAMPSEEELRGQAEALKKPMAEMPGTLDVQQFMGKWYVIAGIPTLFEKGAINPTEVYSWNEQKQHIDVDFTLMKDLHSTSVTTYQQRAVVNDLAVGTKWGISPKVGPFYVPFSLAYLIVHCDSDYEETIIGVPNREYVWIMARTPHVPRARLDMLVERCARAGYDPGQITEYHHTTDPAA